MQDLLYEDKLQKLYDQFPTLHQSDVQHHLSSAQGSYDMAAAMLYDLLENGQQKVTLHTCCSSHLSVVPECFSNYCFCNTQVQVAVLSLHGGKCCMWATFSPSGLYNAKF